MAVFISARTSSPSVDNYRDVAEEIIDRRLDIGPIGKQPCDNLFIIRSNLPICQRISYFICRNSLLEYAESKWSMTDCLLRCLFSASASYNNQSETSVAVATHDIMEIPN